MYILLVRMQTSGVESKNTKSEVISSAPETIILLKNICIVQLRIYYCKSEIHHAVQKYFMPSRWVCSCLTEQNLAGQMLKLQYRPIFCCSEFTHVAIQNLVMLHRIVSCCTEQLHDAIQNLLLRYRTVLWCYSELFRSWQKHSEMPYRILWCGTELAQNAIQNFIRSYRNAIQNLIIPCKRWIWIIKKSTPQLAIDGLCCGSCTFAVACM